MADLPVNSRTPAPAFWRYARAIIPALILWGGVVAGAAFLLYDRSRFSEKYDRAALREWVEERRPNRKNLTELVDDYLQEPSAERTEEIEDQLDAMMEPLMMFRSGTPLFLDLYSVRISFPDRRDIAALEWQSPDRPARTQQGSQVRSEPLLDYRAKDGTRVVVTCDYRMHAFHKAQQEEAERQQWVWAVGGVALGGSLLAIIWIYFFLRRERRRELTELEANQALEHTENLRLAEQLRAQDAERAKDDLVRHLLEQRLEAARQESRAAEAEKTNLEMKSQLYASIGIMAGSYAHNIKNLLVRPNDLLSRCLQSSDAEGEQATMLEEVRSTLGTVTERLQQILRTVRRDPSRAEMTQIDLNDVLRETEQTWSEMAADKWKLVVRAETAPEPLPIRGDLSHLQQAIENLLFNARDASFEMRNHVRETARSISDPARRKQALIEAASWKGQVVLRGRRDGEHVILEVQDNGIGMSEEVRERCIQTHFSTKRDNALYEGYSAGMGLGLSFVVVVLEHHQATMEIDSAPEKGATFRVRFPLAE
ncbi:MAG: HAMP domain-containing histidine kinase [Planctomycetes bacterium]|nr:HAMP domain-containing histidine kinase [Planctomycetota bacterium]